MGVYTLVASIIGTVSNCLAIFVFYRTPKVIFILILSSSGPGPGPRSGPGQVPGQVQKVQGLRTKDLDLG